MVCGVRSFVAGMGRCVIVAEVVQGFAKTASTAVAVRTDLQRQVTQSGEGWVVFENVGVVG